jgi:predicted DsbA family dithiol-disulfide isomerase
MSIEDVGMKVEMWADVVCSWCGIASERINQAVAAFGDNRDIELVHRSFRLLPDRADGGINFVDLMAGEWGNPRLQVEQMGRRVEGIAHEAGIPDYHVLDNTVGNTTMAHELLAFASDQGQHTAAWDRLFRAHFAERAPLWSIDDLLVLAADLGLEPDATREALATRLYRPQVEEDHAAAGRFGASGVPFVVVDRRYALAGAQEVDTYLGAFERAWAERQAVRPGL